MPKTRTATIKAAHSYLTQPDIYKKTSLHRYLQRSFAYHGASIPNREVLWQQLQKESLRRAQISQSNDYQESIRAIRYGIAGEILEETPSLTSDKRIIWYLIRLGELSQESIQNLPNLFERFEENAALFDVILEQLKQLKSNNCILGCLELIRIDIQRMPYRHSKISQDCLKTINQYSVRGILPQNAWGYWFREIYEQDPEFNFSTLKQKVHFTSPFFHALFPTTYQPQKSSWYDFVLDLLETPMPAEERCQSYLYIYFLVPTEYQELIEKKVNDIIHDSNQETLHIQRAIQNQYQCFQWCREYQISAEKIPNYKRHTDITEQNILAWIQLYKAFEQHQINDKTWTELIGYILNNKEIFSNEKCMNLVMDIAIYGNQQKSDSTQTIRILEEYSASLRPYFNHLEITQLDTTLLTLYEDQNNHEKYKSTSLSIDTSTSKQFKEMQNMQIFDGSVYSQKRASILAKAHHLHKKQDWDGIQRTFKSISEDYLRKDMLFHLSSCMTKRNNISEKNIHILFSMVQTLPQKQKEEWYEESSIFLSTPRWLEVLAKQMELIENPTYHALYAFIIAHQYKEKRDNQWNVHYEMAWDTLQRYPFKRKTIIHYLTKFGVHEISKQIIVSSLDTTKHNSSHHIHDDILGALTQTALQKNHINIAIQAAQKIQNPKQRQNKTVDFFSAQASEFGWSLLKQEFHHERWLESHPYFNKNQLHRFTEVLTQNIEQTTSKIDEIDRSLEFIFWDTARDACMHFHEQKEINIEKLSVLLAYQQNYQKSNQWISKIPVEKKRVQSLIKIMQVAMLNTDHDVARSIIQKRTQKEILHLFNVQSWPYFHTLFDIYTQLEPLPQSISFLDEICTAFLEHIKSETIKNEAKFVIFWDISRLYQMLHQSEKSKIWEEKALSFIEKKHNFKDPKQIPKVMNILLSIIEKDESIHDIIENQKSSHKALSLSVYTQYLWEKSNYKDSLSSWKRALSILRTISNSNRQSFSLLLDQIQLIFQDKKEVTKKGHIHVTHNFLHSRGDNDCKEFLKRLPHSLLRSSLLLLPQDMEEIMFGIHLFIIANYKENEDAAIQLLLHPKLADFRSIFESATT